MMTLNVYSQFLTRSISLGFIFGLGFVLSGFSQGVQTYERFVPNNYSIRSSLIDTVEMTTSYPDPKKVLKQSLMIPGWGQVTNKQVWKVPIVYGVIGGLTYYSVYLHKKYHDYRAAYYNLNPDTPDDNRFGATPDYIPDNANLSALQQNRNFFRNRRDLVYVFIGLSYALNAIDAYVFAHLRSFDVSDDLSMGVKMQPNVIATDYRTHAPSLSFSINF